MCYKGEKFLQNGRAHPAQPALGPRASRDRHGYFNRHGANDLDRRHGFFDRRRTAIGTPLA
jgi:hypothetical protein